nr:unnamed protein product [Digitaria exilis]
MSESSMQMFLWLDALLLLLLPLPLPPEPELARRSSEKPSSLRPVTSSVSVKRLSSTATKATTPFLICFRYLEPMPAVSRAEELRFSA